MIRRSVCSSAESGSSSRARRGLSGAVISAEDMEEFAEMGVGCGIAGESASTVSARGSARAVALGLARVGRRRICARTIGPWKAHSKKLLDLPPTFTPTRLEQS
ncbi:MAG TPA: hypothetical protein VFK05_38870 [Polyangiaceae bacterium]|nr:hypothetical protein [Polyangiaceae bacterium]